MLGAQTTSEAVVVERLRLAVWLRFNGERLVERRLEPDGAIKYLFEPSGTIAALTERWEQKTQREIDLSRFSKVVSFEIQTAVRLRRAAGLPTRLRYAEKS